MKYEDIKEIGIDIETYSSVDLPKTGVYPYAESDDFEIMLFSYGLNGGPVKLIDLASGETLPGSMVEALQDPKILKTAFNAAFERICLSKYLGLPNGTYLDPAQWDCTMVRGARMGLPLTLEKMGEALGVDKQKLKEGKDLIRYFAKPCSPTKANGGRTRNLPSDAPDKWELYKKYNIRDVETEQQIREIVTKMKVTPSDRKLWILDQHINDRGVLVDVKLAENAVRIHEQNQANLIKEAVEITGISNPNSVSQLKEWLEEETGESVTSLSKKDLPEIKNKIESEKAKRLLDIRTELGKTSVKKYTAMLTAKCADDRVRGITQFYGAARTGRFSGRIVQLQNLPQNHIPDIDLARRLVRDTDLDEVSLYYGNVPGLLSELIRTAFVAKDGCTFHVCDFSAIEARVSAWVAGEQWVLDTFINGGDIYCATASQMFHVPVEKHGQNAELRQKGKISVLALGYGGAVNALKTMGGEKMGLTEEEMADIVRKWRKANSKIAKIWKTVESSMKRTILTGEKTVMQKNITFTKKLGGVSILLPSGREIFYPSPEVRDDGRITFMGQDQRTKKWCRIETFGGRLFENIVQAIARDCLAVIMLRSAKKGIDIVFHVHDEIICECDERHTLQEIEELFAKPLSWADGLPLKGAGYTTRYYLKD